MEECPFEFDVTNLPPMPDKRMTRVFQCPICGAKRTIQKRKSYYHFPQHNKPAGSGAQVACWKRDETGTWHWHWWMPEKEGACRL